MATIQLNNVTKNFGGVEVIHGANLSVEDGEFVVFVGPSGCGKSTLLRLLSGLEDLSSGEIAIDGARVDHLPPAQRGLAMVFQSYALYPHMTVYQNMSYALKVARKSKQEIDQRVRAAAEILQLTEYLESKAKKRFLAVSDSGLPLAVQLFANRVCFCLMSLCQIWTRSCGFRCASS